MMTGYLALVGSGSVGMAPAVLAGLGSVGAFLLFQALAARRDWFYAGIQILACLELLSAALISVNLSFFLYLASFLLFLVSSMATGEIRRSTRRGMLIARGGLRGFYSRLGGLAVSIGFGILALTIALFFVLPRTAHAALNRMVSERYHLPGFSKEVRLGEIGRILTRTTPAMHVRIVGGQAPVRLKWRGMALTHFDGKRWTVPLAEDRTIPITGGRIILGTDDQRRREGARITYEVLLETISSDVLFFAGVPEVLWIDSPVVLQGDNGVYRLGEVPQQRLRYGALSYLDGPPVEAGHGAPRRSDYLQLPFLDRRVPELARQVTAQATTDEARASAIARYLRTGFAYTTELPSQESPDPLAQFLFERKRGHCEYFASAMAIMLRTLGIPSRVATGFDGGVLNPITGWYVVRASDAHSWVEAWIEDRGWMTFDPTPPARVTPKSSLWSTIAFYSDAAEMFWQEWIVGYDFSRQLTLAAKMHNSGRLFGSRWLDGLRVGWLNGQASAIRVIRPHGGMLAVLLVLSVLAWLLVPKALKWWKARQRVDSARRGGAVASDATLLYSRMSSLLRRRGHPKPAWMTPGEFARGLPQSETADLVRSFTSAYHELRYGRHPEAAERMLALLDRLEHAAAGRTVQ